MGYVIDVIREARKTVKTDRAAKKMVKRKFDIALAYNTLYTYGYVPGCDGKWMCPTCNAIHASTEITVFTGRQYPACCGFPSGHRQFKVHATDM